MKKVLTIVCLALFATSVMGQTSQKNLPLDKVQGLTPLGVTLKPLTYAGKRSVQVVDTAQGITSTTKLVRINDLLFHNGTIELEVAGKPRSGASGTARGFIGLAFRLSEDHTKFECIYLRPANGRAEDQVRRNHSVQYISHPDHPWERLRKEEPEKYETYVDLEVGVWTKVKIEVQDNTARLFVHGATQPTLIVKDLKQGTGTTGGIALWIGPETEGYFRNLTVTPKD
jgi:hypothetical protein